MSVEHLQETQHIDKSLMDSLDKLSAPTSDPSHWFPAESCKTPRHASSRPKEAVELPEPEPVEPDTIKEKPEPAAPDIQTPASKQVKKMPSIPTLYLPGVLLLGLVFSSILAKVFHLPFIPSQLEPVVYILLAFIFAPCVVILSLLQAASLRHSYIYASSGVKKPTLLQDIALPAGLSLWPFVVTALLVILLFAVPSSQTTFAAFSGLMAFLFLTGPLCMLLAISLCALTAFYRRGSNVEYPVFILAAMDWSERTFNKEKRK